MSRNKERLGGVQQQDSNPPPQMMQGNGDGGFSFVVPTEFVELPSGGKYYPEGHPLHGAESVEIRQMTAKEEDLLTSRTLLKKGVALERVVSNIIVDKRINPDTLLIGDKNAIILATRVSGYGNEYTTKITCPECNASTQYTFDLNEASVYEGGDVSMPDMEDNGDGTFNVVLPRTGVKVTFKLLTGREEKRMINGLEMDRKRKAPEKNVTRQLVNTIVAVNGLTSADAIGYLVENIPSMDSRALRSAYRSAAPNIDLTQHFECGECDYTQDMEVPLTADFFWPDR